MRLPKSGIKSHILVYIALLMTDHPSYVTALAWQNGWSHKKATFAQKFGLFRPLELQLITLQLPGFEKGH